MPKVLVLVSRLRLLADPTSQRSETPRRSVRARAMLVATLVMAGTAHAQYDDDAPPPPVPPKPGSSVDTSTCQTLAADFARRYTVSFAAGDAVGLTDAVNAWRRAPCDDDKSRAEGAKLADAVKAAPAPKKGKAEKALVPLATRVLARQPAAVRDHVELVTALAIGDRKRLKNAGGVDIGTTRRVSLIVRVKDRPVCLELRGDWRVSKLDVDQDDPEYVVLDRMQGDMLGWRNLSNFEFQDLTPAWLVACPKP